MLTPDQIIIVRVNISDLDERHPVYSDNVIQTMFKYFPNINLVCSKLLRSLASKGGQQQHVSLGKISEAANSADLQKLADKFETLALQEGFHPSGGAMQFEAIIEEGNTEFNAVEILVDRALVNNGLADASSDE